MQEVWQRSPESTRTAPASAQATDWASSCSPRSLTLVCGVLALVLVLLGPVFVVYTPPGAGQLVVGGVVALDIILLIGVALLARRSLTLRQVRQLVVMLALTCGFTPVITVVVTDQPIFLMMGVLGVVLIAAFVPDRPLLMTVCAGYLVASFTVGATRSFADPWIICLAQLGGGCIGAFLVQASRRRPLADLAAATAALQRQAMTDDLTGLLNRRGLFERAEGLADSATADGVPVAVLFVDVDGLKAVNDSLGHTAGDELIRAAAGVLAYCTGPTDVLARIGGDEFVMLLGHDAMVATVGRIERQVAEVNGRQRPVRLLGRSRPTLADQRLPRAPHTLSLSVGTSLWHPPVTSLSEVLDRADKAMYEHKRSRRAASVSGEGATLQG